MSSRGRWLLIAAIGVPLVGLGVGAVWLWATLSGGWDNILRGEGPQPGDPEVLAAEAVARGPFEEAVRSDTHRAVIPALGWGARVLGRTDTEAWCHFGQHNWKRDDDYDLACELTAVEVVSVPSAATFRASMVELDEKLRAAGWQPRGELDMDRVLTEYWDELAETTSPGQNGGYSMDDLPATAYHLDRDGRRRIVEIDWAERDSGDYSVRVVNEAGFATPSGEELEPIELVRKIPEAGYAVVLSHSTEYFRE